MITYGHEHFILQSINGVLDQVCSANINLIIANDNSPDDTHILVTKFIAKYNNKHKITYINREKNIGMMPNFIDAISLCTGNYVAICEGDDYWLDKHKLQNQIRFLEECKEYNVCGSAINVLNNPSKFFESTSSSYASFKKGVTYNFHDIVFAHRIPTLTLVYRNIITQDFYKKIELAPHGDWPLNVLIGLMDTSKKYFVSNVKTAVYRHHLGGAYSMAFVEIKKINTAKTIIELNKITNYQFEHYYLPLVNSLIEKVNNVEQLLLHNFKNYNYLNLAQNYFSTDRSKNGKVLRSLITEIDINNFSNKLNILVLILCNLNNNKVSKFKKMYLLNILFKKLKSSSLIASLIYNFYIQTKDSYSELIYLNYFTIFIIRKKIVSNLNKKFN